MLKYLYTTMLMMDARTYVFVLLLPRDAIHRSIPRLMLLRDICPSVRLSVTYVYSTTTTTTTTTTNVMDLSAAITQLRGTLQKSSTAQCRRLLTIGVDGATSAV